MNAAALPDRFAPPDAHRLVWVKSLPILIAECFSWYAVLTTNYSGNAIENSIWAVAFFVVGIGLCRLLPEFDGPVRVVLAIAIMPAIWRFS